MSSVEDICVAYLTVDNISVKNLTWSEGASDALFFTNLPLSFFLSGRKPKMTVLACNWQRYFQFLRKFERNLMELYGKQVNNIFYISSLFSGLIGIQYWAPQPLSGHQQRWHMVLRCMIQGPFSPLFVQTVVFGFFVDLFFGGKGVHQVPTRTNTDERP